MEYKQRVAIFFMILVTILHIFVYNVTGFWWVVPLSALITLIITLALDWVVTGE